MTLRVWLQEGPESEPGWRAWALDFLGFATWAPTRAEVLSRVPSKFEEHRGWAKKHGLLVPHRGRGLAVVEELSGHEVLFAPDRDPATPKEIDRTVQLLECSRRDLLATIEDQPDEVLDWDPPYRSFASWADWRTIRANLAHIANTEIHYYLRHIGYESVSPRCTTREDWRLLLSRSRDETLSFVQDLKKSPDLRRVKEGHGEHWSVRKVLRRLVWHELLHWKSIRRIVGAYEAAQTGHSGGSVGHSRT